MRRLVLADGLGHACSLCGSRIRDGCDQCCRWRADYPRCGRRCTPTGASWYWYAAFTTGLPTWPHVSFPLRPPWHWLLCWLPAAHHPRPSSCRSSSRAWSSP
ncbi:hypothetical protein TI01_1141 [Lysobacter sp. A03]|nr:hypothetical protein TI01_1141 [Lysobacter sp. A03]